MDPSTKKELIIVGISMAAAVLNGLLLVYVKRRRAAREAEKESIAESVSGDADT